MDDSSNVPLVESKSGKSKKKSKSNSKSKNSSYGGADDNNTPNTPSSSSSGFVPIFVAPPAHISVPQPSPIQIMEVSNVVSRLKLEQDMSHLPPSYDNINSPSFSSSPPSALSGVPRAFPVVEPALDPAFSHQSFSNNDSQQPLHPVQYYQSSASSSALPNLASPSSPSSSRHSSNASSNSSSSSGPVATVKPYVASPAGHSPRPIIVHAVSPIYPLEPRNRPWYSFFAVYFILLLCLWASFSFLDIVVIPHAGHLHPALSVLEAVVFFFLVIMSMLSLLKAVYTDPGFVPDSWALTDVEQAECIQEMNASASSVENKKGGGVRKCRKCVRRKPDRAHHCSSCERCVLKMDHHCIWLNNCVGYHNHKYFLLFINYSWMAAACYCLMTGEAFGVAFSGTDDDGKTMNTVFSFFIIFMFGLALLFFSIFHWTLVFRNLTTLESMEKQSTARERFERHSSMSGMKSLNPYDLGAAENFKSIFGTKWWAWFMPTNKYVEGDGLVWKTLAGSVAGHHESVMSRSPHKPGPPRTSFAINGN